MPTSDDDLQAKRDQLDDLRRQVAEAKAAKAEEDRERVNDATASSLDAEADSLKAQLAEIEREKSLNAKDAEDAAEKAKAVSEEGDTNGVDLQAGTAPGKGPGFQARWDARQSGHASDLEPPASGDTGSTADTGSGVAAGGTAPEAVDAESGGSHAAPDDASLTPAPTTDQTDSGLAANDTEGR